MYLVANSLPKQKEDEIVDKCRELLRNIKEHPGFRSAHDWNAYVVGVHNYYKGMNGFCENFHQIGWRIKKLFYHTMSSRAKFMQEQSHKNYFLDGAYKTWGKKGYYCFGASYPVIQIEWANWDSSLITAKKSRVTRKNPYYYGEKKHKPGASLDDISYLVEVSRSLENSRFAMFRISKYSSVKGVSYLSGEYVPVTEYHCHHIKPTSIGGTNDFMNLCVLSEQEHIILHSLNPNELYMLYPKKTQRIKSLIGALRAA